MGLIDFSSVTLNFVKNIFLTFCAKYQAKNSFSYELVIQAQSQVNKFVTQKTFKDNSSLKNLNERRFLIDHHSWDILTSDDLTSVVFPHNSTELIAEWKWFMYVY